MAHTPSVDANYRFIAASQEVNARIQQRQQALALYVTLVVSLLAALVALKPGEAAGAAVPVEWLMLGFPTAAVCLAFLNYKAERAITNLRRFLSALEQLDQAHERLPSYNTHAQWALGANHARRFHDYAAAVLVAGGNAVGLGAVLKIYPQRMAEAPWTLGLAVAVSVAAVAVVLLSPRWGFTPGEQPAR